MRRWAITPRFRRYAQKRLLEILQDNDSKREEWIAAVRAGALLDSIDARRDRDEAEADQGQARLQLDAHLVRLASDPAYAAAVAALPIPGPVIESGGSIAAIPPDPSCPSSPEQTSDNGCYAQQGASAEVATPCPLGACDGGGYLIGEGGAIPCECQRPARGERGRGGRDRVGGGRGC